MLLLLGAGIALQNFSQSATLDLIFDAPFKMDTVLNFNKPIKPHQLILSVKDKDQYYKYFEKYIRDTGDYSGVFWNVNDGSLVNYDPDRFIKEANNKNSEFQKLKSPTRYEVGIVKNLVLVEKIDTETGEQIVDENGDPIYFEKEYEKSVYQDMAAIGLYEDWTINNKGFHKKIRAIHNLMFVYDDEGNLIPVYLDAFSKALKTKLKTNKNYVFKKDVTYDYLFFPNYDKLLKENNCVNKYTGADDAYLKHKDEDHFA